MATGEISRPSNTTAFRSMPRISRSCLSGGTTIPPSYVPLPSTIASPAWAVAMACLSVATSSGTRTTRRTPNDEAAEVEAVAEAVGIATDGAAAAAGGGASAPRPSTTAATSATLRVAPLPADEPVVPCGRGGRVVTRRSPPKAARTQWTREYRGTPRTSPIHRGLPEGSADEADMQRAERPLRPSLCPAALPPVAMGGPSGGRRWGEPPAVRGRNRALPAVARQPGQPTYWVGPVRIGDRGWGICNATDGRPRCRCTGRFGLLAPHPHDISRRRDWTH